MGIKRVVGIYVGGRMSRYFFSSSGTILDFEKVTAITPSFHWDDGIKTPAIEVYMDSKNQWSFFNGSEKELVQAFMEYAGERYPNTKVPIECKTCGKKERITIGTQTCSGCGTPLEDI